MKQNGFVLFVSLVLLVIMTLLGVAMFKGFTLDELMGGNLREKHRSFDAAQSALNYAEFWLSQPGNATTGGACTTLAATPQICTNAMTTPTTLPWTAGVNFVPPGMTVQSSGSNTYAANPTYYIQYLGVDSFGATLYLVTAAAKGGNDNAVAVVQSVYKLSSSSGSLNP